MRYRTESTGCEPVGGMWSGDGGVRGRVRRLPFRSRRSRYAERGVPGRPVRRACSAECLSLCRVGHPRLFRRHPAVLTCARSGQATVEAAFAIPVLFVVFLLLLQPGIILYDRTVMMGAAAEGCRLLATRTEAAGAGEGAYREAVLRRLGSIPPEPHFHVHDPVCTWDVELVGSEFDSLASVRIATQVEPLPIVGAAAGLLGALDEDGMLTVEVVASAPTQPDWVVENELGMDPRAWVGRWT